MPLKDARKNYKGGTGFDMKVIYVAGKYQAKTEWGLVQNIRHAERVALELWGKGWAVICPHKNTAHFGGFLDDAELDHQLWLNGDLELLRRCDAIYMLNNWETSRGARMELELAKNLGLEIYYE